MALVFAFIVHEKPTTKKNHMQVVRGMLLPSKQYREYEARAIPYCPKLGIDYPVNVEVHYYMPTRRKVDITNLESAILDVMVKAGTLADDNCTIVVSTDGSRVHYDKEHPRTEVIITTSEDMDKEFLNVKGGR